jgi:hypothetical protein
MFIELGSMLSLKVGKVVYEELEKDDRVTYVFLETGRSKDLFEDRQFGEFGEAAVLTVIVDKKDEKEIFEKIYETSKLSQEDNGVQYTSSSLIKTSFEGSLN